MAFGINRRQLEDWKRAIDKGEIAFLTHYWLDERFPGIKTVTKVGCKDIGQLIEWGKLYQLNKKWIHYRQDGYSHFDLLGHQQIAILQAEGLTEQLEFALG